MPPLHELFRAALPRLTAGSYRETSPPSDVYNCIAWAMTAADDDWWWPDLNGKHFWPPGVPREETIPAFVAAFATCGYTPCADGSLEPGVEKVVLYALGTTPTHAARQLALGWWTSKLGPNIDIEHDTPEAVAGGVYGAVVVFFARPLARREGAG
jgi:hypothetical protein